MVAALGRRSVKQAFRRPQFLAPILIFPSLFLAVNTGGAGAAVNLPGFPDVNGFLDFELGAAMVQSTLLAGLSGGIALAIDIEIGFTDRLFAAPVPRYTVVLGRFVATMVLGLLTVAWFLAAGLIFGAEIESGIPGVLLILIMVPLAALAFGTIGGALALRSGQASVVQGLFPLVFVILFVSSAFFPSALMEEPASTIAQYNPISYVAEGIRNPIIHEIDWGEIAKGLGGIAIIGGIGGTLSALALRSRLRSGG